MMLKRVVTMMNRKRSLLMMSSIDRDVIWSMLATAMLGFRTATKSARGRE